MANTTTQTRGCVTITGLDADWTLATDLATYNNIGLLVASIQFNPSGAGDRMIIHDGGIDAITLFDLTCAGTTDIKIKYWSPAEWMWPVIDITDCTLATAANAKVIIHFVNWAGRPGKRYYET